MFEEENTEEKSSTKQLEYKSGVRFEGGTDGRNRNGTGVIYWPDGSRFDGEFRNNKREGLGRYYYSDGSIYDGNFSGDMRHGDGELRHSNGEIYKGQFFRDACHGIGSYIWTSEEKIYTGTFYRNKFYGYGIMSYGNGDRCEGMFRDSDRFGPGIYFRNTESPTADIGLWLGPALFRICTELPCSFKLSDYMHLCLDDNGWIRCPQICLCDDLTDQIATIRPVLQSMEVYRGAIDVTKVVPRVFMDHSIDDKSLAFDRARFDIEFYGGEENYSRITSRGADAFVSPRNGTPAFIAMLRLASHFTGRESLLSFSPEMIMNGASRSDVIGEDILQGACEEVSSSYIRAATEGDVNTVLDLFLDSSNVPLHPDVCDCHGNGALLNAAVGGHIEMVEALLNNGCNANIVNDDCVTPLLACFTLFYPASGFKTNLAEHPPGITVKDIQKSSTDISKSSSRKTTKSKMSSGSRSRSTSPKKKRSPSPKKQASRTGDSGDNSRGSAVKSALKTGQGKGEKKKEENEKEPKEPKNHTFDSPPQTPSFDTMPADNIDSQLSVANVNVDPLAPKVLERAATLLSENEFLTSRQRTQTGQDGSKEDAVRGRAIEIAQHRQIGHVIDVLLRRGADVNAGLNPMPCLHFAVRSCDVDMVKRLLLASANPNTYVNVLNNGSIASLHIAVGLPGSEAVEITTYLLNALADPTARADLSDYFLSNDMLGRMIGNDKSTLIESVREEWELDLIPEHLLAKSGGPTPLHIACARDDDYLVAAHIVRLLLEHKADPNLLCQGHSPLTLTIVSGNDMAVDLLLSYGCNTSQALTNGNGSPLCVATNPDWEKRRTPAERIKLLNKLIAAGADALLPIQVGPKRQTGTFVDYAYHMYNQDRRIAHTPFHALSSIERETHTARKELLNHCGDLLRTAVQNLERKRYLAIRSRSPSADFVNVGGGVDAHASRREWKHSPLPIRKVSFHYCYQCGRSVGVRLTPCTRCKEVYYCSKNCKLTSWNLRHKDECMRVETGRGASKRAESPTPAIHAGSTLKPGDRIIVPIKHRSNSVENLKKMLKELNAKSKSVSIKQEPNSENNYSFV